MRGCKGLDSLKAAFFAGCSLKKLFAEVGSGQGNQDAHHPREFVHLGVDSIHAALNLHQVVMNCTNFDFDAAIELGNIDA
jgi:hypothetical protein